MKCAVCGFDAAREEWTQLQPLKVLMSRDPMGRPRDYSDVMTVACPRCGVVSLGK